MQITFEAVTELLYCNSFKTTFIIPRPQTVHIHPYFVGLVSNLANGTELMNVLFESVDDFMPPLPPIPPSPASMTMSGALCITPFCPSIPYVHDNNDVRSLSRIVFFIRSHINVFFKCHNGQYRIMPLRAIALSS